MSRPWIFVCPSSRGIGFALTRHLLRTTCPNRPILATARPSTDLDKLKEQLLHGTIHNHDTATNSSAGNNNNKQRLHLVHMDVTREQSIKTASHKVATGLFPPASHHLHLAFALPGILHPERSPAQVDYDHALETFKVNTLGPMMLIKWFERFLPRNGTVIDNTSSSSNRTNDTRALPETAVWTSMSARVGSTSDNRLGGWYSYRASKAAVNSITKTFDHRLRQRSGEKAMAVAYHPGTVATDLSKEFWDGVPPGKLFTPEHAAEKMAWVVMGLKEEQRGRVWAWDGKEIMP